MEKMVTLSMKEQKRLHIIMEYLAGRITGSEAAIELGLSLRQLRRIVAAYRKEGVAAVAHGNRGRPSTRAIDPEWRERILLLARTQYQDYNDTHFTDKLEEKHDIIISRSTVRRLRRSIGQGSPRKRRPPRHRSRRERRARSGDLLQLDGSPHPWLEDRGPQLNLIAAIDDATGELVFAIFREQEDSAGYFELMKQISISHGLPLSVYTDGHTIFRSPKEKSLTIADELEGKEPQSQFERLLEELGIRNIPASSPQAKGRVERLFGTLQDRLVKELREAGATTLEEANQALLDYIPRFNARFQVSPQDPVPAYRAWPDDYDRDDFFCFKHHRTVKNDNTISFAGNQLQIPPGPNRICYARARVDVHQNLDGSLAILYKGQTLTVFQPANPDQPVRVMKFTPANPYQPLDEQPSLKPNPTPIKKQTKPYKPPPDHPWRHSFIRPKQHALEDG